MKILLTATVCNLVLLVSNAAPDMKIEMLPGSVWV